MSFLWDSLYSAFARTRNYHVDPPGEENPENPELAITGEGRGATPPVVNLHAKFKVSRSNRSRDMDLFGEKPPLHRLTPNFALWVNSPT